MNYTDIVAEGLDKGLKNTQILRRVLEAEDKIEIPPKVFVFIDRYKVAMKGGEGVLSVVEKAINENEYPFFQDEPVDKQILRRGLKVRAINDHLGLFDEKGRWQEREFQKLYAFIDARRGEKPNHELLKLFAKDLVDKGGKLKSKKKWQKHFNEDRRK